MDMRTGKTIACVKFEKGIDEIFAVEAVEGYSNPIFAGSWKDGVPRELWII